MLIIVNPYATTVSDRLKNLVVYALQGRYEVEAVLTEAQNHATEIGAEARDGGYDIVVAFGGDGTLNEIANGLAGTDVPVTILPGGSTNVVARTLGIPNDVVDATEHLLGLADRFEPRQIDLGIANGRRFVFACGSGLDATAAMRVDRRPKLKARGGPYFYTWVAVWRPSTASTCATRSGCGSSAATRRSRASPCWPRTRTRSPTSAAARSASARGSRSTTGRSRSRSCGGPRSATWDRSSPACSTERLRASRHRQIEHFDDVLEARVELDLDRRGRASRARSRSRSTATTSALHTELELGIDPGALTIVA